MRKILLIFFIGFQFSILSHSQVYKKVITPGTLKSLFTQKERDTITNLTVEGVIDARDFEFLRDYVYNLSILNIKNTHIAEYNGPDGTNGVIWGDVLYPADEIPFEAFHSTEIDSVLLPDNIKRIGTGAFIFTNIKSIDIPDSVQIIADECFSCAQKLVKVKLPSHLIKLGKNIFEHTLVSELDLPESLTSLPSYCFAGMTRLRKLKVHAFMRTIGDYFISGTTLNQLTFKSIYPPSASTNAFSSSDLSNVVTYVPKGSVPVYKSAKNWSKLTSWCENTSKIDLSTNHLEIPQQGTHLEKINIKVNSYWKISNPVQWVNVLTMNGTGNSMIPLVVSPNLTRYPRRAVITLDAVGLNERQLIVIDQKGIPSSFEVQAGKLASAVSTDSLQSIEYLLLKGSLNAKDFQYLRTNGKALKELNLKDVKIERYAGSDGPYVDRDGFGGMYNYPANILPAGAFRYTNVFKNLKFIELPDQIIGIDRTAFKGAVLDQINFPPNIRIIGDSAFIDCPKIQSITLPLSLNFIGISAFSNCISLESVVMYDSVKSIGERCFQSCSSLKEIHLPATLNKLESFTFSCCSNLRFVTMPDQISFIGASCFEQCTTLTNCKLPLSLKEMGDEVFIDCTSLNSIALPDSLKFLPSNCYFGITKLDTLILGASLKLIEGSTLNLTVNYLRLKSVVPPIVGSYIKFSTGRIIIPSGCKKQYLSSKPWNSLNPEECDDDAAFTTLRLETRTNLSTTHKSKVVVGSAFKGKWLIKTSAPWLDCSPVQGSSNDSITINVTENLLTTSRVDTICLYGNNMTPRYLVVKQDPAPKVVQSTFGTIYTNFTTKEIEDVQELTICGTLNEIDMTWLRSSLKNIKSLDLTNATIISCTTNYIQYKENTINNLRFDSLCMIKLPGNLETIGDYAFKSAINLKTVELSERTRKIGRYSFSGCSLLNNIEIPASVRMISDGAFQSCNSLRQIKIYSTYPDSIEVGTNVFDSISIKKCILYVPKGCYSKYRSLQPWSGFPLIFEMSGVDIPDPTKESTIQIWPNPCTSGFQISGFETDVTLQVVDMHGKLIRTHTVKENDVVDMSGIPAGVYFVRIRRGNNISVLKVTKM